MHSHRIEVDDAFETVEKIGILSSDIRPLRPDAVGGAPSAADCKGAATVVGVLIEVPWMLSVVKIVNQTRPGMKPAHR